MLSNSKNNNLMSLSIVMKSYCYKIGKTAGKLNTEKSDPMLAYLILPLLLRTAHRPKLRLIYLNIFNYNLEL